ncbi:hypothetical protein GOODEAATRI_030834, partial [Goodea atripinnis]
ECQGRCRPRCPARNGRKAWAPPWNPWARAGLGLEAVLVDPKKQAGGRNVPCNQLPAAPVSMDQQVGLCRPASCCLVRDDWAVFHFFQHSRAKELPQNHKKSPKCPPTGLS